MPKTPVTPLEAEQICLKYNMKSGLKLTHVILEKLRNTLVFKPFPPMSANWHLQILLCLTPDDITHQWGTPWEAKG